MWKNLGVLDDNFVARFLTFLNLIVCAMYAAFLLATGNCHSFVNAFCQGKDPAVFLAMRTFKT